MNVHDTLPKHAADALVLAAHALLGVGLFPPIFWQVQRWLLRTGSGSFLTWLENIVAVDPREGFLQVFGSVASFRRRNGLPSETLGFLHGYFEPVTLFEARRGRLCRWALVGAGFGGLSEHRDCWGADAFFDSARSDSESVLVSDGRWEAVRLEFWGFGEGVMWLLKLESGLVGCWLVRSLLPWPHLVSYFFLNSS